MVSSIRNDPPCLGSRPLEQRSSGGGGVDAGSAVHYKVLRLKVSILPMNGPRACWTDMLARLPERPLLLSSGPKCVSYGAEAG